MSGWMENKAMGEGETGGMSRMWLGKSQCTSQIEDEGIKGQRGNEN